ncbi:hypothetical protein BGZ88_003297 [Linnemannia elongata]|nr:hypothetical protein BGZ88_003297 [Linnemannia elongata]
MEETQSFRLIGTTDIEEIACYRVGEQSVVYWEDVEQVFPYVKHVKNGNVTASMVRDSLGVRISPHCIKHYPGVVLDVVLSTTPKHHPIVPRANSSLAHVDTSVTNASANSSTSPSIDASASPLPCDLTNVLTNTPVNAPVTAPVTAPANGPANGPASPPTSTPIDAPTHPSTHAPTDARADDPEVTVALIRDPNRLRIAPHCIKHYPDVVLDAILSAAGRVHVDLPMATSSLAPANSRADTLTTNPPTDAPIDAPIDAPTDGLANLPIDALVSAPADALFNAPPFAPANAPTESPADAPTDALPANPPANPSTNVLVYAPSGPPITAPPNPLASAPINPLVNPLSPTNAPINTPNNPQTNSQLGPHIPSAINDVLFANPPSSSSAKGSERGSTMALAESVPTLAIAAGTSIDHPSTEPCQGFQSAVIHRLDAIHDQGAMTQQIVRKVLELSEEMKARLILIQSKTEAILNQQLQLAEYPIPRLFIVLPEELTKYDPGNWFRTKFRLHFICECGKHTEPCNSKVPHHLHLAKHEGYLVREPSEFFKKYGPFLLLMLELIKFGTSVAGHVVPTLASLKVVELVDTVQQTVESVTAKINYSLECIDSQLAKVQASSPGDFIDTEPRTEITQQSLANYLNDVEGVEGVELRQLGSFLKTSKDENLLGNLYRMTTSDGHVKWVCRDHYRASYQEKHVQKLRDVVKLGRGEFDEQLGRIEIVLESRFAAAEFYSAVSKAKGVLELIVELRWECSRRDLEALHDALKKSGVPMLRLDLGHFGTSLGHTTFSKLIPTSRYKALSSITELRSMKTVHIVLPKDFAMLSSFHPKRPSHLLELSFELVAGLFGAKELVPLAEALKTNSTLTTLDLQHSKIGSHEVEVMAEALKTNSTIITLYLGNNSIGDDGAKALAEALKTYSTLTTLNLDHNSIGDNGAQALAEALKTNAALTALDLRGNSIWFKGFLAFLESLKTNSTLITLDLYDNLIGDDRAKALAEALKTNSILTALNLGSKSIGDDGAKALGEALKTNSTLTTLDLYSSEIGDDGAKALAEALKTNSTLTTLDLESNKIGNDGARALGEVLKTNSTLTTLNLESNSIGSNGAKALAETLKTNSTLTTLDLRSNKIGPNGAQALTVALKLNPTLITLNLQYNSIGDNGAKALGEALKTNITLTTLNLQSNSIGDDGAKVLSGALKINPTLTVLDLRGNSIWLKGFLAFSEALKINSTLTTLDLYNNKIGNDGAKALAEAFKTNSALTTLNLQSSNIGDDGAKALDETLKTNSTLTSLNLESNSIGSDGAKALAEALKTNSTVSISR